MLRTGSKKGFTLIEVLLAVSILAIGLVGVLRSYSTSTNAMERALYDMDAVFLLKKVMGQIEEQAIVRGGSIVPGGESGEFASVDEVPGQQKRSDPWLWSESVSKLDFPVKNAAPDSDQEKTKTEKPKKYEFSLNELKLVIANSGRSPLREISVETWVGTQSVKKA